MSRVECSAAAPRPNVRWLRLAAGSSARGTYHWGRGATQVAFPIFVLTETQCVPTGSPLASVRCRKGWLGLIGAVIMTPWHQEGSRHGVSKVARLSPVRSERAKG